MNPLDEVILLHAEKCTDPECDLGARATVGLAALRAAVAESDAAIEKAVKDEREACEIKAWESMSACGIAWDVRIYVTAAIRARNETVKP